MNKATSSLRQQMTLIILLCWLLPMAIAARWWAGTFSPAPGARRSRPCPSSCS